MSLLKEYFRISHLFKSKKKKIQKIPKWVEVILSLILLFLKSPQPWIKTTLLFSGFKFKFNLENNLFTPRTRQPTKTAWNSISFYPKGKKKLKLINGIFDLTATRWQFFFKLQYFLLRFLSFIRSFDDFFGILYWRISIISKLYNGSCNFLFGLFLLISTFVSWCMRQRRFPFFPLLLLCLFSSFRERERLKGEIFVRRWR